IRERRALQPGHGHAVDDVHQPQRQHAARIASGVLAHGGQEAREAGGGHQELGLGPRHMTDSSSYSAVSVFRLKLTITSVPAGTEMRWSAWGRGLAGRTWKRPTSSSSWWRDSSIFPSTCW